MTNTAAGSSTSIPVPAIKSALNV